MILRRYDSFLIAGFLLARSMTIASRCSASSATTRATAKVESLMEYDARTLRLVAAFNTSLGSILAGIGQSGAGPAADDEGTVFVITGNGKFDRSRGDFGNTVSAIIRKRRFLNFTPE
jgi:hypothetical protein